jgi:hypothetical protein
MFFYHKQVLGLVITLGIFFVKFLSQIVTSLYNKLLSLLVYKKTLRSTAFKKENQECI